MLRGFGEPAEPSAGAPVLRHSFGGSQPPAQFEAPTAGAWPLAAPPGQLQAIQLLPKFRNEEEAIYYFEEWESAEDIDDHYSEVIELRTLAKEKEWDDLVERIDYVLRMIGSKQHTIALWNKIDTSNGDGYREAVRLLDMAQENEWEEVEEAIIYYVRRVEDEYFGDVEESVGLQEEDEDRGKIIFPDAVFTAIKPEDVVSSSSKNICEVVQGHLTEYLKSVRYNSVEDAAAFLDHLAKRRLVNSKVTPQEALRDFDYRSTDAITKANGAQCVGQGVQFAAVLREEADLPAYPCAAKFAGKEYYGHGAAMIKFSNPEDEADAGYILMDPGFSVAEPVVITKAVPANVRGMEYRLDDSGSVKSYKDSELKVTFPPQKILNPDEAITRSALLAYDAFTIVARSGKKKWYIQLDLKTEEIKVVIKGRKGKTGSTKNMDDVADLITEELAEMLGYKEEDVDVETSAKARLMATLRKVVAGRRDILDLQGSRAKGPQSSIFKE